MLARISSHQGDPYDPETVERDFNSIWNTGYFENLRIEKVDTPACVQLVIYVLEKPTIRSIDYTGLNSVTLSDVQERFKKAKVGLTVESQYDPTRVKRAEDVLKDLLAEHGHQFATIKTEIKKIPPSSVGVTYRIKEGPTVKVGKIAFDGNYNLSSRELREAMVNTKPIGIPHSIILEDLFARTFDASKLDEDTQRVQQAYQDKGYFKAQTSDAQTHVRDEGGLNWFTLRPSTGKRIDIMMPVDEGDRYRLGSITFTGVTPQWNVKALRALFTQKDGEWFDANLFRKGLKELQKAYGSQGYIKVVASPVPHFDEAKKTINWVIDIDQDKQFIVSRIEFTGNTVTRDKVIRRELLLEEGQVYSQERWDISVLRLNQLGYFDVLKTEDDTETRQNDDGTVDLLLKVKEKGKNSIGVNGGISGLSGTFVGLNYSTNNFLGLGETLSANANIGDLSRNVSLGFNEPYLRNKPIAVGFEIFDRKSDYNPAKAYSISNNTPANISQAQQSLLTNYNTATTGFTASINQPLKKLFAGRGVSRVGLTYSLSRQSITTFNDNTRNVFQSLAFRSGVEGPNQLNGILTSVIAPSFSYSSVDRPVGAHSGRDLNLTVAVAGAGGNVKYIQPVASFRQYYPMHLLKFERDGRQVLGMRVVLAHVNGFGGEVAPPTDRIYGGGETELRGFDIRSASPYTFVPVKVEFNLTNPDGIRSPARPHQPQPGQHPDSAAHQPAGLRRRRHPADGEPAVPDPDHEPGQHQFVHRLRHDRRPDEGPIAAERRRRVGAGEPAVRLPAILNGACYGGQEVPGFSPQQLATVPHTNFVPRMSNGSSCRC